MAIRQSEIATGQKQVPQAYTAGALATYVATFTIPTGMTVATADILELAVLPADHRIVDAMIIPTGSYGASVTADVGIMSGEVGDTSASRTVGDEVFDAVALTAMARMTLGETPVLATSDKNRSIGVNFSAAITGAGQTLTLQLVIAQ